jgi:hypothetical protein
MHHPLTVYSQLDTPIPTATGIQTQNQKGRRKKRREYTVGIHSSFKKIEENIKTNKHFIYTVLVSLVLLFFFF